MATPKTTTTIEVTPAQLPELLRDCHKSKLHPFIQGAPGVGKSACVAQYAQSINAEFIDARLAYYAPQDVQGYPYLHTDESGLKTMRFSRPAFWPRTQSAIIALEEFNCSTKSVQNVALQLLNEGRVGEHILPPDTFVCLLGNRPEDRVNIEKLSSAVVNRICMIRVRLDLNGWIKWAQNSGIDPMVTAFLRWRPELLSNFDGAKWDGVSAFSTPRGWEKANRIYASCTNRTLRHALLDGTVGPGAAAEFLGFLGVHANLPDLDVVLMNPDTAPLPTEPSAIYATCAGLAIKVRPKTMTGFITYLSRIGKEFCMFATKTAVLRDKNLANTPAFTNFVADNPDIFTA